MHDFKVLFDQELFDHLQDAHGVIGANDYADLFRRHAADHGLSLSQQEAFHLSHSSSQIWIWEHLQTTHFPFVQNTAVDYQDVALLHLQAHSPGVYQSHCDALTTQAHLESHHCVATIGHIPVSRWPALHLGLHDLSITNVEYWHRFHGFDTVEDVHEHLLCGHGDSYSSVSFHAAMAHHTTRHYPEGAYPHPAQPGHIDSFVVWDQATQQSHLDNTHHIIYSGADHDSPLESSDLVALHADDHDRINNRTFHATTFQITVLSFDNPVGYVSLNELNDLVGNDEVILSKMELTSQELSLQEMAAELQAAGYSPQTWLGVATEDEQESVQAFPPPGL